MSNLYCQKYWDFAVVILKLGLYFTFKYDVTK